MIRHSTLLLLSLAFVPVRVRSQVAQQSATSAETFIALEHKWNNALVKKDAVGLAGILADGYISTDEDGHLRDKAAILSRLQSGARNFQSMNLSDVHVHVYGNTAIVTGVNTVTGTNDKKSIAAKLAFTDTFVRQDSAWRAVATHVSAIR